jgi:hypothetical protein
MNLFDNKLSLNTLDSDCLKLLTDKGYYRSDRFNVEHPSRTDITAQNCFVRTADNIVGVTHIYGINNEHSHTAHIQEFNFQGQRDGLNAAIYGEDEDKYQEAIQNKYLVSSYNNGKPSHPVTNGNAFIQYALEITNFTAHPHMNNNINALKA